MARTVLSPYQLPGDYAGSGAEVLDQDTSTHGGPYYTGIGANTMYENYRGTLVHDTRAGEVSIPPEATTLAPILYSASQNAEYRPRILGFSNWTTQRVQVWFYINFILNGASSGTVNFNCTVGSTATTVTHQISATTAGWVQLQLAGQNPLITDAAEYEDFDCAFVVNSGTWDQQRVEAIHIFYPVNSTALQAPPASREAYQFSGFTPLDDAQFTGEAPRSTSSLHHLHKNIDYLDTERVGNFCGSANMDIDSSTRSGDTIITQWVPWGVTSAKFWLRTDVAGTTTVTLTDNTGNSANVATSAASKASLTLTVTPGELATFLITTNNLSTVFLREVDGYWEDV
jgi:hypothetical protein